MHLHLNTVNLLLANSLFILQYPVYYLQYLNKSTLIYPETIEIRGGYTEVNSQSLFYWGVGGPVVGEMMSQTPPQFSSHLNETCYTWSLHVHDLTIVRPCQRVPAFFKFLYIHIFCDKAIGCILLTISSCWFPFDPYTCKALLLTGSHFGFCFDFLAVKLQVRESADKKSFHVQNFEASVLICVE